MIQVPEEIKELLKQRNVRKNCRVHFPNGDSPLPDNGDITNINLVAESVEFTESICSQDELKFGLCEASTISFQTFNIPNIKGKTIDVSIELDCTSLIDSNIDGIITRDDLDYPVFPISYGKFIVDSCPRDSANMQKRKITAYSEIVSFDKLSNSFEVAKQTTPVKTNTPYTVDAFKYLIPSLYTDASQLKDFEKYSMPTNLTKSSVTGGWFVSEANFPGPKFEYYDYNTTAKKKVFEGCIYPFVFDDGLAFDALLEIQFSGVTLHSQDDVFVIENVSPLRDNILQFVYDKIIDYLDSLLQEYDYSFVYRPNVKQAIYDGIMSVRTANPEPGVLALCDQARLLGYDEKFTQLDSNILYLGGDIDAQLFIPTEFELSVEARDPQSGLPYGVGTIVTYDLRKNTEDIAISKILLPDFVSSKIAIPRVKFGTHYSVESDLQNKREILEAVCELSGFFGKYNRQVSALEFIKLSGLVGIYPHDDLFPSEQLYPNGYDDGKTQIIKTDMYRNAWYDDYPTKLYSKVVCNYKNSSDEDEYAEYIILDVDLLDDSGNKVFNADEYTLYDISDNYIIQNSSWTQDEIISILKTLANNIERIQYMPADIDCIGLPYVEAGDVLDVFTHVGGFETIALRRTLSGIQALSDNYESKG